MALTIAASLAQIGEFSFIMVTMGVNLDIMPPEARDLVVAGAILSILINPALFRLIGLAMQRHAVGPVDPDKAPATSPECSFS